MTRNWEKPDIESAAKASPSSQQSEQQPHSNLSEGEHFQLHAPGTTTQLHSTQKMNQTVNQPEKVQPQTSRKRRSLPIWQLSAALLVIISGGIGFTATSLLLELPTTPNCPKIFWPLASASRRLYCAQLKADEKTVDSLLKAIALVEALPDDHPLRSEINRYVEQWASEILDLAEEKLQAGELEEAIAIARKIPDGVQAYSLAEDRIERWQSIWSEAEEIYAEAERQLRSFNWNQAFREAVQLTNIDNRYWATTKYQETIDKIQLAREESRQLDGAYVAFRKGGIDNWLKAVEIAEKIDSESYAYQEAQNLMADAKDNLLQYAQKLTDKRNWQELLEVANRIPASLELQEEVNDWNNLASAGSYAQLGTVASLELAIAEAEQIDTVRPLYYEAQQLIERWTLEIEDVSRLSQARQLSQPGTIGDLTAAIAEAELIPRFNPRYQEAQREIKKWNRRIQQIEDQPFLDRARQLARGGNVAAWQEAIAQASVIAPNRSLYQEAQKQIRRWRSNIERKEDQPFLDQAVALANVGNFSAAIDAARQIRRGRTLYQESQAKIRGWRQEIKAREDLQTAYRIAEAKTPEAIEKAIGIARQVPSSTTMRSQSIEAIARWGDQLLEIATDRANYSLKEAIAIARMVPSESSAYKPARAQIAVWTKRLKPPLFLPEPLPVRETNFSPSNSSQE